MYLSVIVRVFSAANKWCLLLYLCVLPCGNLILGNTSRNYGRYYLGPNVPHHVVVNQVVYIILADIIVLPQDN